MTTLAIDIGGTKIAAAVCDENDSIIQRWRVPTPMDADAINQHIAEVYREAVAAGHTDIEAIGISAAGNVSADRKTLTFSANIPAWETIGPSSLEMSPPHSSMRRLASCGRRRTADLAKFSSEVPEV